MAPCLLPGENKVTVAWGGDAKAVRVTWRWLEKGGRAKEHVHVASEGGETYAVAVGAVEPSKRPIDPTLIDALAIEAERGRADP